MLTKAQLRTSVRSYLDDPDARRWTNPELDLIIQFVLDDLWSDMLDVAGYLTSQYQQITTLHAPGYIDLRLAIYGGDLTQRFYRLQQVVANGQQYFAKDPRDYLLTAASATGDVTSIRGIVEQRGSYQFLGDQLWLSPLADNGSLIEIRYSFKPTAFSQMTDGTSVPLPEGQEHGIVLLAAGHAMAKGNAEEATQLLKMGEVSREKLMNSIRRQYQGMTQPFTTQDSVEFGGI